MVFDPMKCGIGENDIKFLNEIQFIDVHNRETQVAGLLLPRTSTMPSEAYNAQGVAVWEKGRDLSR